MTPPLDDFFTLPSRVFDGPSYDVQAHHAIVKRLYEQYPFKDANSCRDHALSLLKRILQGKRLPNAGICERMCDVIIDVMADEGMYKHEFDESPTHHDINFARLILKPRLEQAEDFFSNFKSRLSSMEEALTRLFTTFLNELPTAGYVDDPTAIKLPLISYLKSPNDIIRSFHWLFAFQNDSDNRRIFPQFGQKLWMNLLSVSGQTPENVRPERLVFPARFPGDPDEALRVYFDGASCLVDLFMAPIAFSFPDEQRFSGHWIIAPPGRGKTTLLHKMFLDDVKRDASIIVMDSKGDLINPIKELQAVRDRLILIEPDPDHPLALNPLDIPKTNIAHTVSLLEYIFSALLEAKMTALQMTLFRSVLPALVEVVPNATLETFRDIIENGTGRYKEYIDKLSPDLKDFFYRHFDSKTYAETRTQLIWRLQFLMTNPVIRQMFSALKTKLDIGNEMDAGKIILIDNSKQKLGDEGAEFFGRFFIALVLAAAQQRAGRPQNEKLPCYFYIDECQNVIRRDEKISTILDECRSQRIAMIMAHQRSAQITTPNVLDALANCAIRMANSDDEAKYLADKLRTSPDFMRSLPRGTFATFVRDLTPTALALKIPYTDLSTLPRMTAAEQQAIRQRMRAQFSFTPQKRDAPAPQAPPPPPPASAAANTSKAAPPSPPKTTSKPAATAKAYTGQQTGTPTDPHTGDHTEPASKWGDQ